MEKEAFLMPDNTWQWVEEEHKSTRKCTAGLDVLTSKPCTYTNANSQSFNVHRALYHGLPELPRLRRGAKRRGEREKRVSGRQRENTTMKVAPYMDPVHRYECLKQRYVALARRQLKAENPSLGAVDLGVRLQCLLQEWHETLPHELVQAAESATEIEDEDLEENRTVYGRVDVIVCGL